MTFFISHHPVLNAETTKLTTPIVQPSPPTKNFLKNYFLLCLGRAITTYPYKLHLKVFSRSGGAHAPSASLLATTM